MKHASRRLRSWLISDVGRKPDFLIMDLDDFLAEYNPPEEEWNEMGYRKEIYLLDQIRRRISIFPKNSETDPSAAILTVFLTGRTKLKGTPVSIEITELKLFKTKIFAGTPMIGAWRAAESDSRYVPPSTVPTIDIETVLPRADILLLEETLKNSKNHILRAYCKIRRDPENLEQGGYVEQLSFAPNHSRNDEIQK